MGLLLDATGDRVLALVRHQEFKEKFIATRPIMDDWRITQNEIRVWAGLHPVNDYERSLCQDGLGEGQLWPHSTHQGLG